MVTKNSQLTSTRDLGSQLAPNDRSGLTRRLPGWPKKRKVIQIEFAGKSTTETTITEHHKMVSEELEVGRDVRWAALWLRRLQPRKRSKRDSGDKGKDVKERKVIKTLAEQLHEAQDSSIALPDAKV
jgi:hypothetical protein